MTGWFSGRRNLGLLLTAGATALSLWLIGLSPVDRLVAWKWRCQIDAADDREALAEVSRIAGLGEAGLPELAALLGAERLCVAEAARQALGDEMRRWPDFDPATRRRRQLVLARSLAAQIERFSPDARCVASDMVLRILGATTGTDASESEIVASCDQVLRASAAQRRQRLLARRPGSSELDPRRRGSAEFEANRAPRLASLPGGGLLPAGIESTTPVADEPATPPADDQRLLATNEPARLPEVSAGQADSTVETDEELESAAAILHHHAGTPSGDETEEEAGDEAAAVLRWMFALRANDPGRRKRAEEELRALGFEALQLELAMQLTDPNPTVRRELTESLPAMPGVDARTWLLWLSRDQNADVRLTAMTVMATTGDPNVLRRIEQMARRDVDPRVQRQGERLLKVLEADARSTGGGGRPRVR